MSTYQPGLVPDDPALLPVFLRQELSALKQALEESQPFVRLTPTAQTPAKFRDGDIYEAVAPWNPGAGNGLYVRRAGAWVNLG